MKSNGTEDAQTNRRSIRALCPNIIILIEQVTRSWIFWVFCVSDHAFGKEPLTRNLHSRDKSTENTTFVPADGFPGKHTAHLTRLRKSPKNTEVYRCSYRWVSCLRENASIEPRHDSRYFEIRADIFFVLYSPFDAAFGANTRFSSALGAESTLVGDGLLLAGVSYT